MSMTKLLDGVTGATTGTAYLVADLIEKGSATYPLGDHITVMTRGDYTGLTVKLQTAPANTGPWLDHTDATFTAAGDVVTPLSRKAWVRGVATESGTVDSNTDASLWAG